MWNAVAEQVFQTLKSAFTSAPILAHPHLDQPFYVETDASDFALGAVLSQKSNDGLYIQLPFILANSPLQKSTTKFMTKNFSRPSIRFNNGDITLWEQTIK